MTFDTSNLPLALRRATLVYLGLPAAIFFFGWLRLPLALFMTALLAGSCWQVGWRRRDRATNPDTNRPPRRRLLTPAACLLGGLLPALAFVALSGAGGWGSGDSDWFKHDTILRDLVERPWPVVYKTSAGPVLLVYYVAFYLPAALVGEWTGSWTLATQTLALTMLAGILLSQAWLAVLGTRTRSEASGELGKPAASAWWWRGAAVFYCFSGLDVIGKMSVNLYLQLPVFHGDWSDIEWWAQVFQYPSNAAALFWAPHQAIGAWLPCALLLDGTGTRASGGWRSTKTGALPLALAWIWSPFATIGLTPVYAGLLLFGEPGIAAARWQTLKAACRSPVNLASAALMLVVTLFYSARLAPFALPRAAVVSPGRSPALLIEQGLVSWPLLYTVFALLEFGLLAEALWWLLAGADRRLLVTATTILLLLPLVHYGYANDLVVRGGLPALFTLQILVLRAFARGGNHTFGPLAPIALVTLLALGAANSFLEYRRHADRMIRDHSWRDVAREETSAGTPGNTHPLQSLFELQRGIYNRPGFDFAKQYIGSTESFFQRRLARPAQAPPLAVNE